MTPEIDQAAAGWIARRYAGLTAGDEAEMARWLAADPRHAAAFAELETTWDLLGALREPVSAGATPDADALAPRRRWLPARWLAPALAAAAAIVIGFLAWWAPASRPLHFTGEAVTTVGGFQKLVLPDGSVARLNTNSQIDVIYSPQERRVRLLRGEGHFTVTKDPQRPFFVEVSGLSVRAVGTAFNVRLNHDAVDVLVTEGKVRIDPVEADTTAAGVTAAATVRRAPQPTATGAALAVTLLGAGERALIPTRAVSAPPPVPATVVSPAEIERALAWWDRRLEFDATPLAEIAAEFNRYNRTRLTIADPALAARRFGGSFRADEPEHFVRLLRERFGVRVEQRSDETLLRAAP